MNDTSRAVHEMMIDRMRKLSGGQRLRMASSMRDTAVLIALASLGRKVGEAERRQFIFGRFYGADFNSTHKNEIIKRLSNLERGRH